MLLGCLVSSHFHVPKLFFQDIQHGSNLSCFHTTTSFSFNLGYLGVRAHWPLWHSLNILLCMHRLLPLPEELSPQKASNIPSSSSPTTSPLLVFFVCFFSNTYYLLQNLQNVLIFLKALLVMATVANRGNGSSIVCDAWLWC
jgi:hypothetical protein